MESNFIDIIVKSFFINVFVCFAFFKIANEKVNKKSGYFIITFLSVVIAFLDYILKMKLENIYIIISNYLIQILVLRFFIEKKEKSIMIRNLIANTMAYMLFALSSIIELPIKILLKIENSTVNVFIILIIEFSMLYSFFKIKRFNKGISFITKRVNNEYINIIMINISAVVIFTYCLFGNYYGDITKKIVITFIILVIIMIIMIQKTLTLYYKQKLLEKDITEYENTIKEKDAKIEELSKEKFEISKLNHEFYNRQKALQLKVENIISNMSLEISDKLSVMNQINKLSKEYTGKLENIKHTDKLPLTDIEEVDDMFKYMQNECKKNKIDFKLTINGNIRHMVNKIIPKEKLATLIGDHIRDAIIAICCSQNKFRSIVVVLESKDKIYELSISDTGIEFEVETFAKLGFEPATTHKDRGGNGIGFITTFETLKETRGSLIIEERHPMQENDFTKTVTFRFDGNNEYKICTYRPEEIKDPNNRIIIENINEK